VVKKPADKQQPPRLNRITDVRTLAKIANEFDLSEVEVERGGERIRIRRQRGGDSAAGGEQCAPEQAPPPPPAPPVPAEDPEDGRGQISSPFVGTFYRSPGPESPPFVENGQAIQKGQVLCIVEAMKLMNEIESDLDGKILEILVDNEASVEFGQPLFEVQLRK